MINKLMPNYGWVQNTSNLSTVRDTIELVPAHGIRHCELMRSIHDSRMASGGLPRRWEWDARCRIKAIHALGLVTIDRNIQGYVLSPLGSALLACGKSDQLFRGKRRLTEEEKNVFREGLLTNPPVISVLKQLKKNYDCAGAGLSKYDIGSRLGFAGDIGFTHYEPHWIIAQGFAFNNKEGDADKWARTILSWLEQVDWVEVAEPQEIACALLKRFKISQLGLRVFRYAINKIVRNVPIEMLCSDHHPFPALIQLRRAIILESLTRPVTKAAIIERLASRNVEADETTCEFEFINLANAGFRIESNGGYYQLQDRIYLDMPQMTVTSGAPEVAIEKIIEQLVVKYERSIPPLYIDRLIRYGCTNIAPTKFEFSLYEFFQFLGYQAKYYGQGSGRNTDVLVKYVDHIYANSYGIILDAKASETQYNFPVADKRKMKDYIRRHGPELMSEGIPKHLFSFVSSAFCDNVVDHLKEIHDETQICGFAITIISLLALGHKLITQELSVKDLYERLNTNSLVSFN